MKTPFAPFCRIGAAVLVAAVFLLSAPPAAVAEDSTMERFLEERRALVEEREALYEAYRDESREVREAALREWRHDNRERFEELRALAETLAREKEEKASSAEALAERIAEAEEWEVPANLPEVQRELLEKRHALFIDRLKQQKEAANLPPEERREALLAWRESEAERFAEVHALAEAAAEEAAGRTPPLALPEEPDIPEGVSAEKQAFLEKRHHLMRERLEIYEAYAEAAEAERQAALLEWRHERREAFEELHRLAEEIANN